METTFNLLETSGTNHDCDCCGTYSSSGKYVSVNNNVVWQQFNDGHMYGNQTEESILDCVLLAWNENHINNIHKEHTEENRLNYNLQYPGNAVARDTLSWSEKKKNALNLQNENFTVVKEQCKNLPYNEFLQLKMIALWIESETGEVIICTKNYNSVDD